MYHTGQETLMAPVMEPGAGEEEGGNDMAGDAEAVFDVLPVASMEALVPKFELVALTDTVALAVREALAEGVSLREALEEAE